MRGDDSARYLEGRASVFPRNEENFGKMGGGGGGRKFNSMMGKS
jgi:hypothetical protein